MPYSVELTWHEPRRCWKKYRDGRTYYLGKGKCRCKTDRDGYRLALMEWRAMQQTFAPTARDPFALPAGIDLRHAARMATDWTRVAPSPVGVVSGKPADTTIAGLVREFVKIQEGRADMGEIKLGSYRVYPITLADFRDYCEAAGRRFVDEIDAPLLAAYRRDQLALTLRADEHRITAYTVQQRLAKARKFLQWCYKTGAIDCIPRNLDNEFARVALPRPMPQAYSVDEVRRIWDGATQRTRLYIALGLNCGYRQQDIASLKPEHIDLKARTIRRMRSKSGVFQPHRLWTITAELLRREMAPSGSAFALMDEHGQCLRREVKRAGGKVTVYDTIRLAFDRVLRKVGMESDERRFATLRKTGATELNRLNPRQPHLVSQYLAHEDAAVKRFYVVEFYEHLFAALDTMEGHFGLSLASGTTSE